MLWIELEVHMVVASGSSSRLTRDLRGSNDALDRGAQNVLAELLRARRANLSASLT